LHHNQAVRRLANWRDTMAGLSRPGLATVIILYGALLRLDALTAMYGPVTSPAWLHALQESRLGDSRLRPAAVRWYPEPVFPHADGIPTRYRSDPYTYLQYAREMRSFYAAHRREPLFPFATKLSLALLSDQDVAVSFASATFSLLAIAFTFVLGAESFSPAAGAVAALLLAIECDAIYWSCLGWRDDAFTFTVVASAWAMARFRREPSRTHATLLGACAGASCLVRVTALSFIVPAFAFLLAGGTETLRQRSRTLGLAAAVTLVLVAPYLLNCWRTFGDPLYAINVHADVYRSSESADRATTETAAHYIGGMARQHPIRTFDTFVLGMTQYPFTNKWTGFDRWFTRLGASLSIAALLGVIGFAVSADGRLLLVVLLGSLMPFAFTWRLVNDWRFTEHAYPFLLLAAALAMTTGVRALSPAFLRRLRAERPPLKAVVIYAAILVVIATGWAIVTRIVPPLIFKENLRENEPAVIIAGDRDAPFFGSRWPMVRGTNVSTRVSRDARPFIDVPLPMSTDYDALLRLDASHISILVNGLFVAKCDPGVTSERMGACRFRIPAAASHRGPNRVTLVPASPPIRVWYLRVQRAGVTGY
jgi:4-amino-4-deoxy-L-arabinose transferase-like glycosyltransferase